MTTPAILQIRSDDHDGRFITDAGNPERVISDLAWWIEHCRQTRTVPTANKYREYAIANPDDRFRDLADEPEPRDIQYEYVIRAGAADSGWLGELITFKARSDGRPGMTVWHDEVFFSDTDTRALHQLAGNGIRHIIRFVRSLNRPAHTEIPLRIWAQRLAQHQARETAA